MSKSELPVLSFQQMQEYERAALRLRTQLNADPFDPIDPFALACEMGVVIRYDQTFDPKEWSGGGKVMPNGKLFVMLNGNATPERLNVTLLEEIAHYICEHIPTAIGPNGLGCYDEVQEREAKFIAAAALLPSVVIGQALWRTLDSSEVAAHYGASVQLFEMRVKTLHLWSRYRCTEVAA
jgi:Zn-dependent peptidase ImmA (M78 family)